VGCPSSEAAGPLARLVSDGSVDGAFRPGFDVNGPVEALAVQPDGQILVAYAPKNPRVAQQRRSFASGGEGPAKIVRLHRDGSLDRTFKPNVDLSSFGLEHVVSVSALFVQPKGQVLLLGMSL